QGLEHPDPPRGAQLGQAARAGQTRVAGTHDRAVERLHVLQRLAERGGLGGPPGAGSTERGHVGGTLPHEGLVLASCGALASRRSSTALRSAPSSTTNETT